MLEELVSSLGLCRKIPEGEFEDSALVWRVSNCSFPQEDEFFEIHERDKCESWMKEKQIPAPTLQEILEELRKLQEDVFLKWSETAYNEWFVNAYTHNKEDYQAHDKNPATAALKVWFELKGIKNER